jgi:hypothetical protein
MRNFHYVVLVLLLACTAASAATCEALRLEIASKIKSAGVAEFSVTTVEAGASAPGKVVGTCDQGRSKIIYLRPQPASSDPRPAAEPARPAAQAKRSADAIVTECKDGSVVTSGDCKK